MIKFLIFLFLAIYMVRAITVIGCLVLTSKRLNKRIDLICDSLPDERSVRDLEIEINKLDWYLDNERVASDFAHPFRTIDTEKWINPNLISLLYEHYKIK